MSPVNHDARLRNASRPRRPFSRQLPLWLLAAGLVFPMACGGDEAPTEAPAPAQRPAPPEPPAARDVTPPTFAGVQTVELRGYEFFHLSWEPATDDRSDAAQIRYQVFHIVEPYRELDDETAPIATSDPGATSIQLANDAPPGRYYVRAVDEAGNRSAITSGLAQRSQRPWVRAADGTLLARVTDCVEEADDTALCVGDDGFAARWDGDAWASIELGTSANLKLAETLAGTFVYSDVGHLFTVEEDGAVPLVDVRFIGPRPELPFRQFTADDLGLRYWLDGSGRLYVGADREFHATERPLALAERETCTRLRGIAFTAPAGFALCEDGAAFSSNHEQPGRMWQSLTPNAVFPLRGGVRQIYADADNEAILADEIGVRRVGVGGWSPLLLTEYPDTVHPLDIPRSGPRPARIGRMLTDDDTFYLVSDLGLLERRRDEWELVDDTEGPLIWAHERRRDWTLFYEDGSVARLDRRRTWAVPPQTTGFMRAGFASDGTLLALGDGAGRGVAGIWAWDGAIWNERTDDALPAASTIAGLRGAGERLVAFGARADGTGAVWLHEGRGWRSAALEMIPPPPPPEPIDPDEEPEPVDPDAPPPEPTPPPALRGVDPTDLDLPALTMAPVTDVDVAADGRMVAVAGQQVWWWTGDAWLLLTERPSPIDHAMLDAGESYILIEAGVVVRCWRDQCEGDVTPSTWAPETVARAWRGASGLVAMGHDGSTFLFSAGMHTPDPDAPLIEPWSELPPGSWVDDAGPLPADVRGDVRQRWTRDDADVVWTDDGSVLRAVGTRWVLQGERADALALIDVQGSWALVTREGVLTLGNVPPAHRPAAPAIDAPAADGDEPTE